MTNRASVQVLFNTANAARNELGQVCCNLCVSLCVCNSSAMHERVETALLVARRPRADHCCHNA